MRFAKESSRGLNDFMLEPYASFDTNELGVPFVAIDPKEFSSIVAGSCGAIEAVLVQCSGRSRPFDRADTSTLRRFALINQDRPSDVIEFVHSTAQRDRILANKHNRRSAFRAIDRRGCGLILM
jgi:hypothetical protein